MSREGEWASSLSGHFFGASRPRDGRARDFVNFREKKLCIGKKTMVRVMNSAKMHLSTSTVPLFIN
jgi:hypothetical protein